MAGAWLAVGAASAPAEEPAGDLTVTGPAAEPSPESGTSEAPPKDVALDRLLKLPTTLSFDAESRQGTSEAQWRTRFRESQAELEAAEKALADARAELEQTTGGSGGSQWQMAPPGSNTTENSPVSFKLREDIRRGKEQVLEAERKQRELQVQADLADVPESWRGGA
jgi:hypothetical protein